MDELFNEMQKKGLIEFKNPPSLPESLRIMCDADARKDHPEANEITIDMLPTVPYSEVKIEETDKLSPSKFEVGEQPPVGFMNDKTVDRRN